MPKLSALTLTLCFAIAFLGNDKVTAETGESLESFIWAGGGLIQQESFWAARSPLYPTLFLRGETEVPVRLFAGSIWESQMSLLGGVYGAANRSQGTTDIGDSQTHIYGEVGLAAGPDYEGSVFRLGARFVGLAYGGGHYTLLRVLDEERVSFSPNWGLSGGFSLQAGFKRCFLKQEIMLGYSEQGYQHQLRLGLVASF